MQQKKEENELINRFRKTRVKRIREPITKQTSEEFLFLVDDSEGGSAKWRYHIFNLSGELKHTESSG